MIIHCEGCNEIIAEGEDAEENAFEADARHDREAGIWVCSLCTEAIMRDAMAESRVYDAEQALRAMQDDAQEHGAMTAYLRAKGEL